LEEQVEEFMTEIGSGQAFVDAVNGVLYPPGAKYVQAYNDPTPIVRGLPGSWAVWSHRAERYGLFSAALPAFVDYYSLAGTNIAAGATPVVCYHLSGDDWRLYQFKAQTAAYAVPAELDPIMWDALEPDQRVDRRVVQQSWLEEDLEIGDQIQSGDYAGMYVGEIIVPGGKYPSVEGGLRPAFVSGGTQGDGIRNLIADIHNRHIFSSGESSFLGSPEFQNIYKPMTVSSYWPGSTINLNTIPSLRIDFSRLLPAADDNRVKTIAERIWRRVA
jgi:hypothetical protein